MNALAREVLEVVRKAVIGCADRQKLAVDARVSQATLSAFSKGARELGAVNFINLCRALNIDLSETLAGAIPPDPEVFSAQGKRAAMLAQTGRWADLARWAIGNLEEQTAATRKKRGASLKDPTTTTKKKGGPKLRQ